MDPPPPSPFPSARTLPLPGSFNLDLRFPLPSVPSAQASPPPVPCARILLPPPRSPQLRALPFPGSLQCRASLAPHLASRQWGASPPPRVPYAQSLPFLPPQEGPFSALPSPPPRPSPTRVPPPSADATPSSPSFSVPSPFWKPLSCSYVVPGLPCHPRKLREPPPLPRPPSSLATRSAVPFSDLSVPAPHPIPPLLLSPFLCWFRSVARPGARDTCLFPLFHRPVPVRACPSSALLFPFAVPDPGAENSSPGPALPPALPCPHVRAKSLGSSRLTRPPPPRLPPSSGCFICICLIFSPSVFAAECFYW